MENPAIFNGENPHQPVKLNSETSTTGQQLCGKRPSTPRQQPSRPTSSAHQPPSCLTNSTHQPTSGLISSASYPSGSANQPATCPTNSAYQPPSYPSGPAHQPSSSAHQPPSCPSSSTHSQQQPSCKTPVTTGALIFGGDRKWLQQITKRSHQLANSEYKGGLKSNEIEFNFMVESKLNRWMARLRSGSLKEEQKEEEEEEEEEDEDDEVESGGDSEKNSGEGGGSGRREGVGGGRGEGRGGRGSEEESERGGGGGGERVWERMGGKQIDEEEEELGEEEEEEGEGEGSNEGLVNGRNRSGKGGGGSQQRLAEEIGRRGGISVINLLGGERGSVRGGDGKEVDLRGGGGGVGGGREEEEEEGRSGKRQRLDKIEELDENDETGQKGKYDETFGKKEQYLQTELHLIQMDLDRNLSRKPAILHLDENNRDINMLKYLCERDKELKRAKRCVLCTLSDSDETINGVEMDGESCNHVKPEFHTHNLNQNRVDNLQKSNNRIAYKELTCKSQNTVEGILDKAKNICTHPNCKTCIHLPAKNSSNQQNLEQKLKKSCEKPTKIPKKIGPSCKEEGKNSTLKKNCDQTYSVYEVSTNLAAPMGVDIKSDDWNEASTTKTLRNIEKNNKIKHINQQILGDSQNSTQTSKNEHEQIFEDFSRGDYFKENSKFPPKNSGFHKVQNCDRGDETEKKNVFYDENRNFDNKNSDNGNLDNKNSDNRNFDYKNSDNRNFDNKNSDNRNFDYKNCGFDYNEQISKDRDHGFQDDNDGKKNTKSKNEGFISGRNNSNLKNQEYCECRKNLHPEDDNRTDFYNKIEQGEYLHNKKHDICDDKNVINDKKLGILDDKSSIHDKNYEAFNNKKLMHDKQHGIFDNKNRKHNKKHEISVNSSDSNSLHHHSNKSEISKNNPKLSQNPRSVTPQNLSDISDNCLRFSSDSDGLPAGRQDVSLSDDKNINSDYIQGRDLSLSDKNTGSKRDSENVPATLSDRGRKGSGGRSDDLRVSDDKFVGERKREMSLSDGLKLEKRREKGSGGRSDDLRVSDNKSECERKRDMSLSDGLKLEKMRGKGPVNKKPSVSDKGKRDKSLLNKKQSLSDQFDDEKIKEKLLINKKQSLSDNFDYERGGGTSLINKKQSTSDNFDYERGGDTSLINKKQPLSDNFDFERSRDTSIIDNKQSLKDQIDYEKNRNTSLINKNSSLSDNFDYEKQGDTSLINKNVSLSDQFHNEVIRDTSLINKNSSLSDNFDYEKHRDTSLINTVLSLSDDLDFSRRQEIIQDYHTATCSSVSFGFSCSKGCYGRKEYWKQEYDDGTCSQSSKTDGRCRCDEEEEEDGDEEEEREKERGKERREIGDAPHKVPSDTNQSFWEQQKLRPGTVRRRKKQIGIGVRFSYYVPNRFCPRSGRVDAAHKPVQEYCRCAEKKAPPIEAPSAHTKSGSGDLSSQRPSTSDDDKAPRRKSVTLLPDKADQLDADNDAYLRIVDQNKKVSDWLEPDSSSKAATNETETISFLNAKDPIPSQMGFEGSMVAEEEDVIQKKPKYTLARSRSDPDVIYIRKTVCNCCEGENKCIKIYTKHNDFEVHGSYMELPNCEPVDKDVFESIFEYLNPCRYLN